MNTPSGFDVELRVHGVAATPPSSILGLAALPTEPKSNDCGEKDPKALVQIYDPASVTRGVRAFSWSSLTSGSARTALWILLLPQMLANVAGWAMLPLSSCRATDGEPPPVRPRDIRWITLLVRVGGMVVTAIYVVGLELTLGDLVGYQWGARLREWPYAPAGGVALAAGLLGLLFFRTRVRRRHDAPHPWDEDPDEERVVDPVGYAWLDRNQHAMWNSPGIIARLHRLHFAFSFGLLALLVSTSLAETTGWETLDYAFAACAAAATLFPVALVVTVSLSSGVGLQSFTKWIRWIAPGGGLLALAMVLSRLAVTDLTDERRVFLPVLRGIGPLLAAGLLVLVAVATIISAVAREKDDSRTPPLSFANLPALLLTGATVALMFVVGLASQVARMIGERACERTVVDGCKPELGTLVDWVAAPFTLMLAVLLVALGVIFAVAWTRTPGGDYRFMRTVSRVTQNVSVILTLLALIGTIGLVTTLVFGALQDFGEVHLPKWATWPAVFVLVAVVGGAAGFVLWKLKWLGGLIAVGAGAWFVLSDKPVQVADVALPPSDFLAFAATIAFTLPTAFVVGRVINGLRDRKARETVAIVWDLGNFWPRWFHPLAPRTYSDVAVTALKEAVDRHLNEGRTLLLAPHSQGSIISAASVADSDAPTKRLGYLTYGSPLSRLYAQAFPAVFTRELFGKLCGRLCEPDGDIRWRNLYRPTDPIGGPVTATPPGVLDTWADPTLPIDKCVEAKCGQTHSNYPQERDYDDARTTLFGMI